MEDLETVRKRMRERKYPQATLTNESFSKFYKFAISSMCLVAMLLAGGCYFKTYPDSDITIYIKQHILTMLPSYSLFEKKEVATLTPYQPLGEHRFRCGDETIYCLEDGLVVHSDNQEITIAYDSGVMAYYRNVVDGEVKLYDRVSKNEKLGCYESSFEMVLKKDGNEVNYEEVYS